jgi:hypothetical protein
MSSAYPGYFNHADSLINTECTLCNGEYHQDVIEANREEVSWIFEPYRDFRSAARAKQRERRRHKGQYVDLNSFIGRMQAQAQWRAENKRAKREITRFAILESQRYVQSCTLSFEPTKHKVVDWDLHPSIEHDEWLMYTDDLARYQLLYQNADVFESTEPYIEVGENFATWGQRRIAEMRSVKESRIRRNAPLTSKPMLWQDKMDYRQGMRYTIYTGDASTTTLPTNAYDALGHKLLRFVLDPGEWWVERRRRSGKPPFRVIKSYVWFGEYEWHWHQNLSGCWEIARGWECTVKNAQVGVTPAPEEMQRCSLAEWVGEEGREIVLREEAMVDEGMICPGDDDPKAFEYKSDCEWSMVSSVSSETWSVVGDPC